jgi:hypothetical protein
MLKLGGVFDPQVHKALDVEIARLASGAKEKAHAQGEEGKEGGVCDENNPVLDVGSNLGTLALYAAAAHGCHVHAFEIQPDVECRLRMSARRNAATRHRVVVHRSAVHSTPVLKMTFPATGANPGGAVQVESSPPCVA